MKKIIILTLAVLTALTGLTTAFAATDPAASQGEIPSGNKAGDPSYSIVSAVVNKTYDFKYDFHDSYPYDEDFYTVGIFELDDYNGDVTLTLKNNGTGEEFVFERNADTEWSVKATVDHLLYETAQVDAAVHIYSLGGEYGIEETDIPVEITVVSSRDSADFHKYPSYDGSWTSMYEGEDFTVDEDPSSADGKAAIHLLKTPWLFSLCLYNAETKETEYYETDDAVFEFPTEAEVSDFDPSRGCFWFFLPSKLIMDDGYEFEFTMSVQGFLKERPTANGAKETDAAEDAGDVSDDAAGKGSATKDSATKDSAPASPDSAEKTGTGGKKAVQTADSATVFILGGLLLIAAAVCAWLGRKRRTVK